MTATRRWKRATKNRHADRQEVLSFATIDSDTVPIWPPMATRLPSLEELERLSQPAAANEDLIPCPENREPAQQPNTSVVAATENDTAGGQ